MTLRINPMNGKFLISIVRYSLLIALFSLPVLRCGREKAEETEGGLVPDHIGKARALYQQGNYTGAVEMYHKALEMDPDNADAYLQLGIIYDDNLKDERQAVYFYNRFLELEPDSEKADRVRRWLEKSKQTIEVKTGAASEASPAAAGGQELPSPAGSPPPVPGAAASPPGTPVPEGIEAPPPSRPGYIVQQGDTLARIAQKFYGDRTAWKQIYQANRDVLANPNDLKVGQELKIPGQRDRAVIEMGGGVD